MLKHAAFVALICLAACSRPLSENELQMSQTLFGDTLDTSKVRVRAGIGLLPLPRPEPIPKTHQRLHPATFRNCLRSRAPAGSKMGVSAGLRLVESHLSETRALS